MASGDGGVSVMMGISIYAVHKTSSPFNIITVWECEGVWGCIAIPNALNTTVCTVPCDGRDVT